VICDVKSCIIWFTGKWKEKNYFALQDILSKKEQNRISFVFERRTKERLVEDLSPKDIWIKKNLNLSKNYKIPIGQLRSSKQKLPLKHINY
jgi:hypothetical protein